MGSKYNLGDSKIVIDVVELQKLTTLVEVTVDKTIPKLIRSKDSSMVRPDTNIRTFLISLGLGLAYGKKDVFQTLGKSGLLKLNPDENSITNILGLMDECKEALAGNYKETWGFRAGYIKYISDIILNPDIVFKNYRYNYREAFALTSIFQSLPNTYIRDSGMTILYTINTLGVDYMDKLNKDKRIIFCDLIMVVIGTLCRNDGKEKAGSLSELLNNPRLNSNDLNLELLIRKLGITEDNIIDIITILTGTYIYSINYVLPEYKHTKVREELLAQIPMTVTRIIDLIDPENTYNTYSRYSVMTEGIIKRYGEMYDQDLTLPYSCFTDKTLDLYIKCVGRLCSEELDPKLDPIQVRMYLHTLNQVINEYYGFIPPDKTSEINELY